MKNIMCDKCLRYIVSKGTKWKIMIEQIILLQVSKFILKRIVVRDLLEALPSHAVQSQQQEISRSQSRKRRLSEK